METKFTACRMENYLRRWLEDNYGSFSEGINQIVKEKYDQRENPYNIISRVNKEMGILKEKQEKAYEQIQKTMIEGNLHEKEEAKNILKERSKEEKAENQKQQNLLSILQQNSNLWSEFEQYIKKGWTFEGLVKWNSRFAEDIEKQGLDSYILNPSKLIKITKSLPDNKETKETK